MRLRIWIATALVVMLALPALAHASGSDVIKDCTLDGSLSKSYSQKEYAAALAHMPTDVDEYSDCRDVIRRAATTAATGGHKSDGGGAAGGGGTTGGGDTSAGGSAPTLDPLTTATRHERDSYDRAVKQGSAPVEIDGRPIGPGTLGGSTVNDVGDLPTSVLAILALLAVAALAAVALGTRRLVISRRPA